MLKAHCLGYNFLLWVLGVTTAPVANPLPPALSGTMTDRPLLLQKRESFHTYIWKSYLLFSPHKLRNLPIVFSSLPRWILYVSERVSSSPPCTAPYTSPRSASVPAPSPSACWPSPATPPAACPLQNPCAAKKNNNITGLFVWVVFNFLYVSL